MTSSDKPTCIQPIGDRILVCYASGQEEIRGGVIIPDTAKEKPQEATVIALGTGRRDEHGKVTPFEVTVGDRVLVARYSGAEVTFADRKYTLVREDDILGILT